MEQVSQSPFFPVPVEWFELPVVTGRWDLTVLRDSGQSVTSEAGVQILQGPSAAAAVPVEAEMAAETKTGRILNEYA